MTGNNSYQFKKQDAFDFATATTIRARQKGKELTFQICPYCKGGDNHQDKGTFSISLETGQFECKRASCGAKGNMITLARDFHDCFSLGYDVTHYYNIDNVNAKFRKFKDAHRITKSKDAAVNYLESRGISEAICREYEITVKDDAQNVLVFPFKDETGALQFVKYRNTTYQKGDKGSKEWCEANCKPILFGMNHCVDFGTLVVTEGQIDSLSLAEAGVKNAVSVPTGKNGFTWKPHVWNWLIRFDEIVVFGDNENGDITLAKEIAGFFPGKVRIVQNDDYQGCKDANDILRKFGKDALVSAVKNAKVKVSSSIKRLADVKYTDSSQVKKIKTGYRTLDEVIGGGLPFGELVVLTGNTGEGKSTFASMVVGAALKQKYKVFCYSGELTDERFREWMDCQMWGKKDISEEDADKLSEWYGDQIFLYDSLELDESNLFDAISESVRHLGCQMILIDNLMTAVDDDISVDFYRQQSMFVKQCIKFAKAYNVVILLVAHPKKPPKGGDGNVGNDDISGSSNIANLASVVIRYQRDNDAMNGESVLYVSKNRPTGELRMKNNPIELMYYKLNKRILERNEIDDFMPAFMQLPINEGFAPIEDEEIPFA